MKRKQTDIVLRRSKRLALQSSDESKIKILKLDENEEDDEKNMELDKENDENEKNMKLDDKKDDESEDEKINYNLSENDSDEENNSDEENESEDENDENNSEENDSDIEFTTTHPDDIEKLNENEDDIINDIVNENKIEQYKLNKKLKIINKQLQNKKISKHRKLKLEKEKFELEEMDRFDTLMNKIGTIVQKSEKEIEKLDEKLDEKKIEEIENETLKTMEKLFKEHESKSDIVNKMKQNILKSDVFNINNSIYKNNKINFNFWKCYGLYGLPDNWMYISEYHDKDFNKEKLNENYLNIKKHMISKYISLAHILDLDNITIEERCKLMELYIKLYYCKKDGEVYEFMKIRDKLEEEFLLLKNRYNTIELTTNRDQMKNLKDEKNNIEDEIFKLNLDPKDKKIIYNKYNKMINLSKTDSDRVKMMEWLEFVIKLPYNKSMSYTLTDSRLNTLKHIKDKLDEKIYGLESVKEEILIIVNSKLSNPYTIDNSFCLCAAPGYGKTKIIRLLSEVLSFPFYQISFGGINDVSLLDGHSYTYIGSKSGKIAYALKNMGVNNGILYCDEIDKISKTHHGTEVSNALLHITDATQNMKYYDKYVGEIPMDLSKLWFIFSCNRLEDIDPILLNRVKRHIILPEYTKRDKIGIIKKILPDICSNIKLNYSDIIIDDDIIAYVLNHIKEEKGMRTLIGVMENILKRVKLLIDVIDGKNNLLKLSFYININSLPYTMNLHDLNVLLKDLDNKDISPLHHMYV